MPFQPIDTSPTQKSKKAHYFFRATQQTPKNCYIDLIFRKRLQQKPTIALS
jgi:hypothetical protein